MCLHSEVKQVSSKRTNMSSWAKTRNGANAANQFGATLRWFSSHTLFSLVCQVCHMEISWISINGSTPKDDLQWKIPLTWMIWGYPYFWKPPYAGSILQCMVVIWLLGKIIRGFVPCCLVCFLLMLNSSDLWCHVLHKCQLDISSHNNPPHFQYLLFAMTWSLVQMFLW